MKFENRVYPNREQMKGFFEASNDDSPIFMVNLLKFKEKAEYKDGRETNLSGYEAYSIYAKIIEKHLKEIDGELILKYMRSHVFTYIVKLADSFTNYGLYTFYFIN